MTWTEHLENAGPLGMNDTNTKHTPGPWTAEYDATEGPGRQPDYFAVWTNTESGTDHEIASCIGNGKDARLIAAAPDLLEAARKAALFLTTVGKGNNAAVEALYAAIAKAEGPSTNGRTPQRKRRRRFKIGGPSAKAVKKVRRRVCERCGVNPSDAGPCFIGAPHKFRRLTFTVVKLSQK